MKNKCFVIFFLLIVSCPLSNIRKRIFYIIVLMLSLCSGVNCFSQVMQLNFSVSQADSLTANKGIDTAICSGKMLIIYSYVNGGTQPYNFTWNNGNSGDSCKVQLAGNYSVTVSDYNGCTVINDNNVSVNNIPEINNTISNDSVCQGQSVTFTANAISNTTISWQWTKGGNDITAATNSQFSILNSQLSDFDVYSCNISNECGTAVLTPFIFKVMSPPIISGIPIIEQTKYIGDSIKYSLSPGELPFQLPMVAK